MKCPHCKNEISNQAKFCGFCGKKISGKKRIRFLFLFLLLFVIVGVSAAGITGVFLYTGKKSQISGLATVNRSGMEEQDDIQVMNPLMDQLVTDENSAIAAAGEFGEKSGFDNALKELTLQSKNELDSITYYRLQEHYKGVPVYGCTIVLAADESGTIQRINTNAVDIPGALNTDADLSEADAKESIRKYLRDKGKFEMELSDFENKTPVVYAFSETPVFAYQMEAVIDQEPYEIIIGADSKEVLLCTTKNYTKMATARGGDLDRNFVTFTANQLAEDSWVLEDTERNMRVYDAGKQSKILPKQIFLVDSKGNTYEQTGDTWTGSDGKTVTVQEHPESKMQNQLQILDSDGNLIDDNSYYTLDLYGKKSRLELIRENTDFFSNGKAVTLFLKAKTAYDFFEQKLNRTGFNNQNGSMSLVFDSSDGSCSKDIAKDKVFGLLIFHKNAGLTYDDIAHEYTHSVERAESAMIYEGESGAIMEAYSDLFGELVEDYADGKMDGSCDWKFHAKKEFGYDQSRNLKNPKESGNPSRVGEETRSGIEYLAVAKDEVHHCSTIVSHAGYLMTVDGEKSKGLKTKELARLWYHTMLTLPSNCSFSGLRRNMEATADAIGLSKQKKLRIAQAFEEVGIESSGSSNSDVITEQKEGYAPKWVVKPTIEADDIYYIQNLDFDRSWNEQNVQFMGNYAVIEKDGSLGLIGMDGKLNGGMDYVTIHPFGYEGKILLDRTEPVYTEKYKTEWSLFMLDGDVINPVDGLGGGGFTYAYYAEEEEIKLFDEMKVIFQETVNRTIPEYAIPVSQAYVTEEDTSASAFLASPYAVCLDNKLVTNFIYDECGPESSSLLAVKKDGKWGYINNKGEIVIPFEYEESWNYEQTGEYSTYQMHYCYGATEGFVPLYKNGTWEMRDTNGNIVIPSGYFEAIRPVHDGKCWVKKDGKWGVIAPKGEEESSNAADTPDSSDEQLPEDAVEFDGHYYYVYNLDSIDTWEAAKQYCEEQGGYLATITSPEENEFLYNYLREFSYESAYFGLTDSKEEGNWIWENGESVSYTNWHEDEPNSENPDEDYTMFYFKYEDGTWNDGDFGRQTVNSGRVFICEWGEPGTQKISGASYDDAWKQAYITYINENVPDQTEYNKVEIRLLYIDNDDIPELFINYGSTAEGGVICYFDGNDLQTQWIWNNGVSYIEKGNLFCSCGGNMGQLYDAFYSVSNGTFEELCRGEIKISYDQKGQEHISYYWKGKEVSEEEYQTCKKDLFKPELVANLPSACTKQEMLDNLK
ncbi:MAG: M4 family metallopeptidase [Blautia sp.]